jgi:hypothetical protein
MPYPHSQAEECQPLIPRVQQDAYCNFLSKIVAPATQAAVANVILSLPQTLLYPHRLVLDQKRCRKIEVSLCDISRYIHAGTSGADIQNQYDNLYQAVNSGFDISTSRQDYQLYAIRMMKRYGVMDKFAKMVVPAEDDTLLTENGALNIPSLTEAQQATQKNLEELFAQLGSLDKAVEAWIIAAKERNVLVMQTLCQKILRLIFKIFYFLFTISGSGSGFLGGLRVPGILGYEDAPDWLKYICGTLGYFCWVFLFLSYRDSVKIVSFTYYGVAKILFSAFTAAPSALFAGINMEKIVATFLMSAPEIIQTIAPYMAQFSSFASNFALNLGVTDLLLNIPRLVSKFTHGVRFRNPAEFGLTSASLMISAGVGVAGVLPYISFSNLIPHVNLPGIVNVLLCVFGDLPSAMLGAVCLLTGAEPWGVFTNPQYRWAGRLTGLTLGVIAPLVFFGFNADSIVDEEGALHSFNYKILYWFLQMLSGLGNFMAYGRLGLYIQDIFGAQATPPLFPAPQAAAPPELESDAGAGAGAGETDA